MNSFDIDGVIFMGHGRTGVRPCHSDVIITGRSFEEMPETERFLGGLGIANRVFYNPLPFNQKTRESSALHKAEVITMLKDSGKRIDIHFEDDQIQAEIIKKACPWVNIVLLHHNLVEKENVRHDDA